jgi:hypothetical protein
MAHSYESIGLTLVSECEWMLSRDQLYRDPISHTAYLGDIKWEKNCPSVTWNEDTWNTYANYVASTETSKLFNVTLMNPDPMNLWSDDNVDGDTDGTNHLVHENVTFVRLQFRRPGTGEWIGAWNASAASSTEEADLQCSKARGEGCTFEWDLENQYFLNGLKDGPWEIRAKVFCSGYDSFATMDVRGSVTDDNLYMIADVTAPYPVSQQTTGNILIVDMSEEISCPQLDSDASAYSIARTGDCDGNAVNSGDGTVSSFTILSHYNFRCLTHETNGRNSWTMIVPISDAASSNALAGEYTVTINDGYLKDYGGNAVASYTFTHDIGCDSSIVTSSVSSLSAGLGLSTPASEYQHSNSARTLCLGIAIGIFASLFSRKVIEAVGRKSTVGTYDNEEDFLVPLVAEKSNERGDNYGSHDKYGRDNPVL